MPTIPRNETACLIRAARSASRTGLRRELVAEGALVDVLKALTYLPCAEWGELTITLPDRIIPPVEFGHDTFHYLLLYYYSDFKTGFIKQS